MRSKGLAIILAGGRSERLFPEITPKPLLKVRGRSLLEMTLERLKSVPCCVVAKDDIAQLIRKDFKSRKKAVPKLYVEPAARDTAAAVGFVLSKLPRQNRPEWIAVFSADQYFPGSPSFKNFLKKVEKEVLKYPQALFVSGVSSKSQHRNDFSRFGWIVCKVGNAGSAPAEQFVEKPDSKRLSGLSKRRALINSGMFFGTTEAFLKAYQKHFPEVLNSRASFGRLPRQPIDRAIFEKFANVRCLKLAHAWQDLGTWKDWAEMNGWRSKRNFVSVEGDKDLRFHLFGVENLAVIQRGKDLMIIPLEKTKRIKDYLIHG